MENGEAVVLANAEGSRTTPSVVAYRPNNERLVGTLARRQAVVNPKNTVSSVKRFMGRKISEVGNESKQVPYGVVAGQDDRVEIMVQNKRYTPEEVSATILQKLKVDAEAYLGETITDAVITVPAYFNDAQRQATKNAGKIAGLNVLRIINEPTAAALAYGLEKNENQKILVFDLGGGTFDVSILEVGDGVFEVLSTNGDTHLGGDDYDRRVVDWIATEFKRENGVDLRNESQALQRLTEAAEKAKIELSQRTETEINLPFITADSTGPKHLVLTLTRARFEQLTEDLTERCRKPFMNALTDAKITTNELSEVVLVGGSTRMPVIQELVRTLTNGKEPHRGVNPDEVVAVGAAIQGGVLTGEVKDILLLDVTPLSLGIMTEGMRNTILITRNSTIPKSTKETFSTASDNQTSVEIVVLQGERPMAHDNRILGKFTLEGILPAPRGLPQIEVTFDVDANGILTVSAKDLGTGKENKVTITGSTTLSKDEVERMVREAEVNAEADRKRTELMDARQNAEQLVYRSEKTLRELGDKVADVVKSEVEAGVSEVRKALETDNVTQIKQTCENLNNVLMRVGESVYGGSTTRETQSSSENNPQEETMEGNNSQDEEVVDASFREV